MGEFKPAAEIEKLARGPVDRSLYDDLGPNASSLAAREAAADRTVSMHPTVSTTRTQKPLARPF